MGGGSARTRNSLSVDRIYFWVTHCRVIDKRNGLSFTHKLRIGSWKTKLCRHSAATCATANEDPQMGSANAKALAAAEVGEGMMTGSKGLCIVPAGVSKAPMSLTCVASWPSQKAKVTDKATGNVLFTTQSSLGFPNKCTITVFEADGTTPVCVALGKTGFSNGSFRIMRKTPVTSAPALCARSRRCSPIVRPTPLPTQAYANQTSEAYEGHTVYPFAIGTMRKKMHGSAECSYSLIKEGDDNQPTQQEQYKGSKPFAFKFAMGFENMAGTFLAKVLQPGMDPKVTDIEIGKGVDLVAIVILAGMVGAATGSGGGAAGGLAGAGVI